MHTKGKGIQVEFRSKAWTFYLRQQSFARIRSFLPLPKSSQKQGCCHLSSTLFTTRMCLRCAQDTTARDGSSVLDAGSTRETRDRHWLCLGACRASPGRTEEELGRERRIEGGGGGGWGARAGAAAELMLIKWWRQGREKGWWYWWTAVSAGTWPPIRDDASLLFGRAFYLFRFLFFKSGVKRRKDFFSLNGGHGHLE